MSSKSKKGKQRNDFFSLLEAQAPNKNIDKGNNKEKIKKNNEIKKDENDSFFNLTQSMDYLSFGPVDNVKFASQSMGVEIKLPEVSMVGHMMKRAKLSLNHSNNHQLPADNDNNNQLFDNDNNVDIETEKKKAARTLPLLLVKPKKAKSLKRPATANLSVVNINTMHRRSKTANSIDKLPTGESVRGLMQLLPKSRKTLYERMEKEHAAEVLQRVYRGYKDRMKVWGRDGVHWNQLSLDIQCFWKCSVARKKLNKLKYNRDTKAAIQIQRIARGFLARDLKYRKIDEKRNYAALTIQCFFRQVKSIKQTNNLRRERNNKVAIKIQKIVRGKLARLRAKRAIIENPREIDALYRNVNEQKGKAKREYDLHTRNITNILNYSLVLLLSVQNVAKAKTVLEVGLAQYPNYPQFLALYGVALLLSLNKNKENNDNENSKENNSKDTIMSNSSNNNISIMELALQSFQQAKINNNRKERVDVDPSSIDYCWLWAYTKIKPNDSHLLMCYALYISGFYGDKFQINRAKRYCQRANNASFKRDYVKKSIEFFNNFYSNNTNNFTYIGEKKVEVSETDNNLSNNSDNNSKLISLSPIMIKVTKRGFFWVIQLNDNDICTNKNNVIIRLMLLDGDDIPIVKKLMSHDIIQGFSNERIAKSIIEICSIQRKKKNIYSIILSKINMERRKRNAVFKKEQYAIKIQSKYRGHRDRNMIRRMNKGFAEQRRQHIATEKRLRERRDHLRKRILAIIRVQSMIRGWVLRNDIKKQTKCAIKLQSRFRGFKVRLNIAEQKRLKALGIHAKEVYKRGQLVSGHYLIITVLKCGLNYHFSGYDVEECTSSFGWVMNYQVRQLVELFPYGVKKGYEKKPRHNFEDDCDFISAPPHASAYIDQYHPNTTPATPRRMLRDAYQPPEIDSAPKKEYEIQKGQKFRITLSNHEGVLLLLLSLLSLTTPIKNVTEVKREYEGNSGKVLTIDPIYGKFAKGTSILTKEDIKNRDSRNLHDQADSLKVICEKTKMVTKKDLKDVHHTKTNLQKLTSWNDMVAMRRNEQKLLEEKKKKEEAIAKDKEDRAALEREKSRRASQINIERRKQSVLGRIETLRKLEEVEYEGNSSSESGEEDNEAESFYASMM